MAVGATNVDPIDALIHRLHVLGRVLSVLCCLWIAVVGSVLVNDLTPDDLAHHRSPVIQERVKTCEGEFAQRYACADLILMNGHHHAMIELAERLGTTFLLPITAWLMWGIVVSKAQRLRTNRTHRLRPPSEGVAWA